MFEGCRKRIERAETHRKASTKLWNEFTEKGNPYRIAVGVDANGTGVVSVIPHHPFPEDISIEFGEMFYQLRAALDSCIYEAAILETGQNPPPGEEKLEFPICDDMVKFEKSRWKLGPLVQKRVNLVRSVQPYNAPARSPDDLPFCPYRAVSILNDLARKDRHRRLHVTGSWVVSSAPQFRVPDGVRITNIHTLPGGFFLEHENEIAIFDIEGYVEGIEVQVNPNLAIEIAIDEVPAPCSEGDTLGIRCFVMSEAVSEIISKFESSFGS